MTSPLALPSGRGPVAVGRPAAPPSLGELQATTPAAVATSDRFDLVASPDSAPPAPSARPILLYNQACSVCRKLSSWVIRSDDPKHGGKQAIDERPIGSDEAALQRIHPSLNLWDVYAVIHLVMPDGSIKKGGAAIAEVFRRLPSTDFLTPLLKTGAGQWVVDRGYTLLDALRPALGCESCGSGAPVPWYGKPIALGFRAYQAIRQKFQPAPTAS